MKYNKKITIILMSMFIITQLIGLFVISQYAQKENKIPYGLEPDENIKKAMQDDKSGIGFLYMILPAFIIAILFFFLLIKVKASILIRIWFFVVITIALGLTLNAVFLKLSTWTYIKYLALAIALVLAYYKVVKRNLRVHNATELLIYPGIAAIFVPILGVLGITILLLIISIYDMWAVWKAKFMQKMAKFQIEKVKVFGGFFVPFASKKEKQKIKLIKQKYAEKGEKAMQKQFEKKKVKVGLAILGGGDIIFPIIAAGVVLVTYGLIQSLIITIGASLGLLYIFMVSKKKKFYPAMPYITIGIYIAMIIVFSLKASGILV